MTSMFAGAGQQGAIPSGTTARRGPDTTRRLELLIETADPGTRLSLRGTLDTTTGASVHDWIVGSAAMPPHRVHLDLSGLEAATRAGCRAIFVAARLLHRRGGGLAIHGARPDVERVLGNAGFVAVIAVGDGAAPSDHARSLDLPPRHLRVA
jgi:anti-anti-sigma factor